MGSAINIRTTQFPRYVGRDETRKEPSSRWTPFAVAIVGPGAGGAIAKDSAVPPLPVTELPMRPGCSRPPEHHRC